MPNEEDACLFFLVFVILKVALNGQLGLDMLLIRPTDFDLVLLDIVMPGLDGIEVRDSGGKVSHASHWHRLSNA